MLVTRYRKEQEGNLPVDNSLPNSIVHAVEEVQEHRTNVALGTPIPALEIRGLGVHILARVPHLPGIPTTPDNDGEDEKDDQGRLSTDGAANPFHIKNRAHDNSGHDLSKPVQESIEGLGAGVEVSAVNGVLLVRVEPVGGPEHGEEEDDPRFRAECIPQPDDLGFPRGVLHQDHARAVATHDFLCVAETQGKTGAYEHEYDEGDVGAVADGFVLLDIDVLAQGDLSIDILVVVDGSQLGV